MATFNSDGHFRRFDDLSRVPKQIKIDFWLLFWLLHPRSPKARCTKWDDSKPDLFTKFAQRALAASTHLDKLLISLNFSSEIISPELEFTSSPIISGQPVSIGQREREREEAGVPTEILNENHNTDWWERFRNQKLPASTYPSLPSAVTHPAPATCRPEKITWNLCKNSPNSEHVRRWCDLRQTTERQVFWFLPAWHFLAIVHSSSQSCSTRKRCEESFSVNFRLILFVAFLLFNWFWVGSAILMRL